MWTRLHQFNKFGRYRALSQQEGLFGGGEHKCAAVSRGTFEVKLISYL